VQFAGIGEFLSICVFPLYATEKILSKLEKGVLGFDSSLIANCTNP